MIDAIFEGMEKSFKGDRDVAKYAKIMMEAAELFSKHSYARRKKVGAVLAIDGRILITGYNGTISGLDNNCEIFDWVNTEPFESTIMVSFNDIRKSIGRDPNYKALEYMIESYQDVGVEGYKESDGYKVTVDGSIDPSTRDLVFYLKGVKATLTTKPTVLHAEENVIAYAAKKGIAVDGGTVYCTLLPCIGCTRLLAQSGIKTIVFKETHTSKSQGTDLEFFKEAGVKLYQYKDVVEE